MRYPAERGIEMKIYQKDYTKTVLKIRCPHIERFVIFDNGVVIRKTMFIFNGKAIVMDEWKTSLSDLGWKSAKDFINKNLREQKFKKVS